MGPHSRGESYRTEKEKTQQRKLLFAEPLYSARSLQALVKDVAVNYTDKQAKSNQFMN